MAQTRRWPRMILPVVVAVSVLALAVLGAILTSGGDGIGPLNLFVESLSGTSGRLLGNGWALLPLGFAFGAGMVSAVNPCGFVMLPAYLAMYAGTPDTTRVVASPQRRLLQAFLVGGTVTTAFVALFGVVGLAISAGAGSLVQVFPWVGLTVGVLLVLAGAWQMAGGKLYSGLAARAASHVGGLNQAGLRGYFLFGLSYGVASLSCTLPIFLAVVGSSLSTRGLVAGVGQFVLYAVGMGLVILVLTIAVALLKGAVAGTLRKATPYVQPIGAGLMVVAGAYITFYWLTIGGLLVV
ncbi:MAG: cytochrome c biogenesis protein CcdA [Dehalococcoidia bacterium]